MLLNNKLRSPLGFDNSFRYMAFDLGDCTVLGLESKQISGCRLTYILETSQIHGFDKHDTITIINKQYPPTGHDIQTEFLR